MRLRLIPDEEFKDNSNIAELFKILAILASLFLLFYLLYLFFFPYIHQQKAIDLNLLTPWARPWIPQNEGRELPIMFAGSFLYLFVAYLLIINYRLFTWFSNRVIQAICFLGLLIVLLRTNPANYILFGPDYDAGPKLLVVFPLVIFLAVSFVFYNYLASGKLARVYLLFLGIIFGLFVIAAFSPSDPRDDGFFIGPALKLIQGEKLGSFYMQYNLFGTLLFKWMMDLGLKLSQMELVLRIVFVFWFFLYWKVASKLIKDKFLVFLFMVALVAIRYFSLWKDPIFNPQTSVIRLDLWVPLMLIVSKFGFFSPITSLSFSVLYLMDNLWGFLFLAGYMAMIMFLILLRKVRKEPVRYSRLLLMIVPIIVSFAFQLYFYGGLFLPAAGIINKFHYYEVPISLHSMYWIAAFVFLVYLYFSLKEKILKNFSIYFFLLILALLQLVYFYGRSHEHNLINISGIFILILFISFDKLSYFKVNRTMVYVFGCIVILLPAFFFAKFAIPKLSMAYLHLSQRKLIETHPIDKFIDSNGELFSIYPKDQKIFIVSNYDSYLNYRYHYKQEGWYTPYVANIFLDDTVNLLINYINNGYKVVLLEDDMANSILVFNKSAYLTEKGMRFDLKPKGKLLEAGLVEAGKSLETP